MVAKAKKPKLKPCPFCGEQPSSDIIDIWCKNDNCKIHLRTVSPNKSKAIRAWNRRK